MYGIICCAKPYHGGWVGSCLDRRCQWAGGAAQEHLNITLNFTPAPLPMLALQPRSTQLILVPLQRPWTTNLPSPCPSIPSAAYSTHPASPSSSYSYSSASSPGPDASPSSSQLPPLLPVRPSTSQYPRPIPSNHFRIGAAGLLSRSPLLLKPLTEFELSYYQYQRELNHAISKPIRSTFFFRPGSHAAKAFELSVRSPQSSIQLDPISPIPNDTAPDDLQEDQDFHNVQRAPTRFIHLLFKLSNLSNQESYWQLPTSEISGPSDDLTQASLRAIYKNAGPDMDIWSVGRVPATFYKPPPDSHSGFDKIWVMPQRILRGQPKILNPKPTTPSSLTNTQVAKEGGNEDRFRVEDFGWFCSEEIKDRVHLDLWKALEPVLK